ncbi:MAG: hypothetical protein ACE5HJ_03265 [Thermoplasmata archaeon]
MKIFLAATLHDSMGKLLDRPSDILQKVEEIYEGVAVVATVNTNPVVVDYIRKTGWAFATSSRQAGVARREAVRLALEGDADAVHLIDLFQLLHWLEADPEELRSALQGSGDRHLNVIGRSETAMERFPRPLQETCRFVKQFSRAAFGQAYDLMSGCRIISREAGEAVLESSQAEGAEVDGEWIAIVRHLPDSQIGHQDVSSLRHFDEVFALVAPQDPGPRVDWASPQTWVQVLELCVRTCRAAISPRIE